MNGPRVVVQQESHPWRKRLIIAGIAAFVLAFGWGLYALGRADAPGDWARYQVAREKLETERKRLVAENRDLRAENRRLSEQVVLLERAADIDREASAQLRHSFGELQSRVSELKKEVAFYRSIVSPDEAKAGIRIQQVKLSSTGDERVYRLSLVLIQAARHERQVKGRVTVRMEGLRDGESVSLDWNQLALDSRAEFVFSFKYFERLSAALRLPKGFKPTLVEVEVSPAARGAKPFTESHDWKKLIQASS